MGLLDGKKIVVTGVLTDASLAFAVARLAQAEGADIVLTGAGRGLSLTQRTARKLDGEVDVLELDVTQPDHLATRPRGAGDEVGPRRRCAARHRLRPRRRLGDDFMAAQWDDVAVAVHVSAYSLKALADAFVPLMARRRVVRRARLRQPRRLAGLQLDGRRQVGAAERQPLPRQGARAAGHPLQPRRRRTDQDDGRQEHPRVQQVRGHLGRAGAARLGRSTTPSRSPRRASPCSRTGSRPPPARSSTSTAASTPSAPEPAFDPGSGRASARRPPQRALGSDAAVDQMRPTASTAPTRTTTRRASQRSRATRSLGVVDALGQRRSAVADRLVDRRAERGEVVAEVRPPSSPSSASVGSAAASSPAVVLQLGAERRAARRGPAPGRRRSGGGPRPPTVRSPGMNRSMRLDARRRRRSARLASALGRRRRARSPPTHRAGRPTPAPRRRPCGRRSMPVSATRAKSTRSSVIDASGSAASTASAAESAATSRPSRYVVPTRCTSTSPTTTATTTTASPTDEQPGRRRRCAPTARALQTPLGSVGRVNRLAGETSPYLRQHRDNPVDWYPWGPEAFAEARRRDVPVLLSVGYSACHWCHVMAHECFEDRRRRRRHERPLRQRQGRPRGATRRRRRLHGRRAGDDRARRLADDGVPHARRRAVLRRHVLPEAELPAADGGDHRRLAQPARGAGQEHRRPSARRISRTARLRPADGAARRRPPDACRAGAGGQLRRRVGRLRRGAEVPVDDEPRPRARRPPPLGRRRRPARSSRRRSTRWRRAGCTTTSAAASPATRSTASGSSRTSRRCSTTRRCSCASTPTPPSPSASRAGARSSPRPSSTCCATCASPAAASPRPRTPTRPAPTATATRACSTRGPSTRCGDVLGADADVALEHLRHHRRRQLRGPVDPQPAARPRRAASARRRSRTPAGASSRPAQRRPRPGLDDKVLDRVERADDLGARRGRRPARPAGLDRRRRRRRPTSSASSCAGRTAGGSARGTPTATRRRATTRSPPTTPASSTPSPGSPRPPARPAGSTRPRSVADTMLDHFWDVDHGGLFTTPDDGEAPRRPPEGPLRQRHAVGQLDAPPWRSTGSPR